MLILQGVAFYCYYCRANRTDKSSIAMPTSHSRRDRTTPAETNIYSKLLKLSL